MKGGRVLSVFPNKMRNHPDIVSDPHSNSSYHAEYGALRMVSDARGATVYVARQGGNNMPGMSKPCDACEAALRQAGVRKVVYTTPQGIEMEVY